MKNISEYINLPHINTNKTKIKKNSDNLIIQINNNVLSDFYEFTNYNDITNIDENTYLLYLRSIFNLSYSYNDTHIIYNYDKYQMDTYAFETLNNSWDSRKLVTKINDLYKIKEVNYVNPRHKSTQFTIIFEKENINELINDKNFWSLIHLYNYYIKTIIDNDSITLEPYKPEEITNTIYKDLNGILYHITTKEKYINGIKYKELAPKWKGKWDKLANKPYDIWRDGRIFFIGNNDEKKVQQQLKSIRNTHNQYDKKEWIVLKIDLNKYNKLRFRIDSSAFGYDAYFTEEPIPDFCITPIDLDTWKEINKKEL